MAVCVDEPADPGGRWHAKDQLAHLAWWRHRSVQVLESIGTGVALPPTAADDADQNAVIYAATKDRPAAEIKRDALSTWPALREALAAMTDDQLASPHPSFPGSLVWETVPGLAGHLGAHLMSWFMDGGDVDRAEAIARWGYELECSLLPAGPKQADAKYNFACFYARAGRVEEALPLLRDALASNAEFVRWARQDPDLDGMRDDPRVGQLLDQPAS